jgi:hypothetical protein
MGLEERSLERVNERCEECGARLTKTELQAVLESGGPSLCSIHAAEIAPLEDDDASDSGY